ncbi:TetR/AcrR family transcriptional regulator [Puniceicoccaceae bacterium K14]|nr:TetR/AcrR family transcriptional regulator [Puniceicoccaceae bacterium K14]
MSPRPKSDARDRIINAACELFYKQGYHSTSVDQIIAESKVSKPTVYNYFPCKEDLCVGYLEERTRREFELMDKSFQNLKTPRERYSAIIRHVRDRIKSWEYRGCGFMNMLAEISDSESPIVALSRKYIDANRSMIVSVVQELKDSSPEYAHLDVKAVADAYYLLISGAISTCQECRQDWPIERAIAGIEILLKP